MKQKGGASRLLPARLLNLRAHFHFKYRVTPARVTIYSRESGSPSAPIDTLSLSFPPAHRSEREGKEMQFNAAETVPGERRVFQMDFLITVTKLIRPFYLPFHRTSAMDFEEKEIELIVFLSFFFLAL